MTDERPAHSAAPGPITSLDDPRAIQLLSTEHWSLLSARGLAYNEAFTRGGMFLTFISMSMVALALLAQAMSFGNDFLVVAAIVLAFDFVIGITTYGRIAGANQDDLRALHGMARIRHGYVQLAPMLEPYFTTAIHDDVQSVIADYGPGPTGGIGVFWYALTTSGGMIGLIVSMVGGVLAGVLALLFGMSGTAGVWVGVIGAAIVFVIIVVLTFGSVPRFQEQLVARFPAEPKEERP
jgi:hypothetical protein